MKTLAELKEELAIHQQNLNSDLIKNNDDLRESLEQKIEEMITKIENYSGDEEPAPVVEAEPEFEPVVKKKKVVEEKPIVEKEPKPKAEPKAEPKAKEEKPLKTKEPKRTIIANTKIKKEVNKPKEIESNINVGDRVKWLNKKTGETLKGKLTSIRLYKGDASKIIATMKSDDGKTYNAYLKNLTKI